jgi:hypothetical protein
MLRKLLPAPNPDRHPGPAGPPGKLGSIAPRFLGIAPEPARHGRPPAGAHSPLAAA